MNAVDEFLRNSRFENCSGHGLLACTNDARGYSLLAKGRCQQGRIFAHCMRKRWIGRKNQVNSHFDSRMLRMEQFLKMVGQAYGQCDCRQCWIRIAAGGKNRAAANKEIVHIMDFAVTIDHACFGRMTHPCGAYMVVAVVQHSAELRRIVRPLEISKFDTTDVQAAKFASELSHEDLNAMPFKVSKPPIDDRSPHSKNIPVFAQINPAF